MVIPWGAIEAGFRFFTLLLESTAPAQRQAQLIIWFYMWWPLVKLWVDDEVEKRVEKIMESISMPTPVPNNNNNSSTKEVKEVVKGETTK